MNVIGGFSAPPNGFRPSHRSKMSSRQKQETQGTAGRTHINTDVEKPVLRDWPSTRRGRTSIGDAGSWRGINDASPGNYRGFDPDGVAETEADHFGNCPVCGALLDMLDLAPLPAPIHDQEIEIGEGPEPPRERPLH
jgi:hypothetical protein